MLFKVNGKYLVKVRGFIKTNDNRTVSVYVKVFDLCGIAEAIRVPFAA